MPLRLALAALLLTLAACGEDRTADADPARAGGGAARETLILPPEGTPAHEGRLNFGQCAVCHTYREGQDHRIGPNLYAVYGAQAAQGEGFAYSSALRRSGLVWTEDALDAYLADPQAYVPGNRMAYLGEDDPAVRATIIAYLKWLKTAGE